MIKIFPLYLFLVLAFKCYAVDILVSTTAFTSPYYTFSIGDSSEAFNFTGSGSDSLSTGVVYTFTGSNTSGHPFSMYITDPLGNQTNLISNLGSRNSQSFTLDPNTDYSEYTTTYICDYHPTMIGSFNIVPESSSYALIIALLSLALVALRRRHLNN